MGRLSSLRFLIVFFGIDEDDDDGMAAAISITLSPEGSTEATGEFS